LDISRGKYYYKPKKDSTAKRKENEALKAFVIQAYFIYPFYGHRKINEYLKSVGVKSTRDKVKTAIKELGLKAIYPGPRTSQPNKEHKKYPYLLRDLKITHSNQAWSSVITYTGVKGSRAYVVAVED